MDDVLLNKAAIIERCMIRISEVYDNNSANLTDYNKQDVIVLNIQRACEACIDIAMHLVSIKRLGIPQSSREAFDLLFKNDLIDEAMRADMVSMVGFRNIAVHNYQEIDLRILQKIIEIHLREVEKFKTRVIALAE